MQQIDMSREMHMDGRQSAASEVFGCIPHGRGASLFQFRVLSAGVFCKICIKLL